MLVFVLAVIIVLILLVIWWKWSKPSPDMGVARRPLSFIVGVKAADINDVMRSKYVHILIDDNPLTWEKDYYDAAKSKMDNALSNKLWGKVFDYDKACIDKWVELKASGVYFEVPTTELVLYAQARGLQVCIMSSDSSAPLTTKVLRRGDVVLLQGIVNNTAFEDLRSLQSNIKDIRSGSPCDVWIFGYGPANVDTIVDYCSNVAILLNLNGLSYKSVNNTWTVPSNPIYIGDSYTSELNITGPNACNRSTKKYTVRVTPTMITITQKS